MLGYFFVSNFGLNLKERLCKNWIAISLAFGKSKASDFRKTNSDGRGYQPMLTEIKAANFSQSGKIIKLDLTFKDGLERTFVYAFHEKN